MNDKFYYKRHDLIMKSNTQLMVMKKINRNDFKVVRLFAESESRANSWIFEGNVNSYNLNFFSNYEKLTEEEFVKELLTGNYKEIYE